MVEPTLFLSAVGINEHQGMLHSDQQIGGCQGERFHGTQAGTAPEDERGPKPQTKKIRCRERCYPPQHVLVKPREMMKRA